MVIPDSLGLTDEQKKDMEGFIRESIVEAIASRPLVQCRAGYPHDGRLRYIRGNPSYYVCECGKYYMKNGQGGLMDAPVAGR